MGRRVNLAELALEEVPDTYCPPPPSAATASPGRTSRGPRIVEFESATLPVADVAPNPLNERDADEDAGEEFDQLVETIRHHGVLQPIVVCSATAFAGRYPGEQKKLGGAQWVALIGNRRLRAAAVAGLERLPALVNDERVSSMHELMLVENSHRKDLSPWHEAAAMKILVQKEHMSQREVASRIGRTEAYVSQRLALLKLVPALRIALENGSLKVELARKLGTLPEAEQEAIAAAGPPYRRTAGPAAFRAPARRSISASTPAQAAESIRKLFSAEELAELIELLGEQPG